MKLDLGITPILIQQISFAARDPEYTALGFGINEFSVRKSELFRSAIAASRRAGKAGADNYRLAIGEREGLASAIALDDPSDPESRRARHQKRKLLPRCDCVL